MSKMIKIPADTMDALCKDFARTLAATKVADGKISFTKTFADSKEKATVYFSAAAFAKMAVLIKGFDKEVAWHGLAYRGEDETKNEYYITDILVYPQELTGATVSTDQEQYQDWLYALNDDQFNNLRMQGHSHVNMGVSPSGTDLTHQEKILAQLEDDMFYIFMIWNKSFSVNCKIYDLKKNILFEPSDCTIEIDEAGSDLNAFMADAKTLVKNKAPATPSYVSGSTNAAAGVSAIKPAKKISSAKRASTKHAKPAVKMPAEDEYYEDAWIANGAYSDPFYYSGYGYGHYYGGY